MHVRWKPMTPEPMPRRCLPDRQRRSTCVVVMLTLLFAVVVGAAHAANGSGFRVIVHPDNPVHTVSRELLNDAFLKKVSEWSGGENIRPVDLLPNSPVRRLFSEQILRRPVAAIRSYWQQRIFAGRGLPPPELESDAAVLSYVRSHRGGVGYVSDQADTSSVKVLTIR
jgi:ABC-type phosphate transport system substrate-binding protein